MVIAAVTQMILLVECDIAEEEAGNGNSNGAVDGEKNA